MPSYFTITEPHPTVPQNSYTHSGRGGAGNMFRAPATTPSTGVPTPLTRSTTATSTAGGRFYSGRGGAGNAHAAAERPIIAFDEEYARHEVREKVSTISHVGRGGAGNVFSTSQKDRKPSDASSTASRRDSVSTNGSTRSGFWGRLSISR
ncbi:hypothetical protein QBC46DRAFT_6534 [Diplogelasinospora grovesii]|uniref:Uncharacterized protein n=1 Tax=Diplogelasinospora grovesii TaxID=303347 RepID=A0AAN6NI24_9PEZI|nr:hypothetical protein QBC46DRAFT_6534 [Diplogelasinospora grovesii]